MPLVKSGKIVPDVYVRVEADAPVPATGPVLVSAERYLAEAGTFQNREGTVGVIWPNNRNVAELEPYLDRISLVALMFPAYKDGRAYSQARLLRERYKYRGELRATGQVLRDQFLFLLRAGFDSFDVVKQADAEAFEQAAHRYTVFFQPTGDGRMTVARARLRSGKAPRQKAGEKLSSH